MVTAEPATDSRPTADSNPHQMGKQATGVAVAAAVVLLMVKLGGLAVVLAGALPSLTRGTPGSTSSPTRSPS
jgi:choline dehydrogenase-like flavoprotein